MKAPLRIKVWDTYIGREIAEALCPLCDCIMIRIVAFVCGHVLATSNGGADTIENLRPICGVCNSSMNNQHMTDYAKINCPHSRLLKGLPENPNPIEKIETNSPIPVTQPYVINNIYNGNVQIVNQKSNNKKGCEIQYIDPEKVGDKHTCLHCHNGYATKASLDRHINNNSCWVKNPHIPRSESLKLKRNQEEHEHALKQTAGNLLNEFATNLKVNKSSKTIVPDVMNNTQNTICFGVDDNLLDILAYFEGLPKALEYLKECVFKPLSGDYRILEKVYKFDTDKAAIMYTNKSKTEYVYYDEYHSRILETDFKIIAKKLADILHRSYMKGIDILVKGSKSIPQNIMYQLPKLTQDDIKMWNEHLDDLKDETYQTKLLTSLMIHIEYADQFVR